MSTTLDCAQLYKSYGKQDAVRGLNMELEENVIYGLLGRNGAGKTTLLNMIAGNIFPDAGQIVVGGARIQPGGTPRDMCCVREKNLFLKTATISEVLTFASVFHPNWDWALANRLLGAFKLNPKKKIRQCSRGMESMVGNIIGLVSRAPLTLFDEPVLGLDVVMRDAFYRALLEDYAEHPRTILLSTHLIDEIANVVERAYIMDSGSIVLHDDVEGIKSRSHMLTGGHDALDQFTPGKNVIYKESYGRGSVVAVFDTIDDEERVRASHLRISIDRLPLQKFFAYFVEGGHKNND